MNYADKFKCYQLLSTATYQNISEYGQKMPRHREEETQRTNNHMTPTTQLKQCNQLSLSLSLSLSQCDDCETRNGTKYCITKYGHIWSAICVCGIFCIRESPSQFKNRILPRVYIRSMTRSTMYQKAPFC